MASEPFDDASDDDKVRFLVTITKEDLAKLDKARKLAGNVSRNRFVIAAVWKAINSTKTCEICGREDEHEH